MAEALETRRLLLRPWSADDVELLARLSSLPRVTRYIGDGQTWSALKAVEVSERALAHWRAHGFGWHVVLNLQTGADIGFVGLNLMGEGTAGLQPDEHEIGWWISPEHWGHGYAREAAGAVQADAFTRLSAPQITARIRPENTASVSVATAIGMSFQFNTVAEPGVLVAVYRSLAPPRGRPSGAPA